MLTGKKLPISISLTQVEWLHPIKTRQLAVDLMMHSTAIIGLRASATIW